MKRPLLLLTLAAVLVAGLWWWEGRERTGPAAPGARAAPDLILEDFEVRRYQPDGHLALRLRGTSYRHYRRRALDEIQAPVLEVPGPVAWRLQGDHARLLAGDYLVVQGHTRVERRADGAAVVLESPQLRAWLTRRYVAGDGPVRVQAPWGTARAGALEADLQADRVWLEGGVHSRYLPEGRG